MIQDDLLAIINTYNSNGYYKYGNLPANKLQNAMQSYPVDPSDTPLALIDSTVFGSAKTGMVIGLKGVYFKNDWTTKTDKNFISWEELSRSHSAISNGAMSCIMLIPGCEINMSGSSMKKDLLINLLNQLVALYKNISYAVTRENDVSPLIQPQTSNVMMIENSIPSSNEAYQSILPEVIALCIVADGNIEDQEVELATSIIENDDLIVDKHNALESLLLYIEKFISDKDKSSAVFKLKANTVASKLSKITDSLQKENISIILDGMMECISCDENNESQKLINTLKSKLNM